MGNCERLIVNWVLRSERKVNGVGLKSKDGGWVLGIG